MGKKPSPKGGGLPGKKSGSVTCNKNVLSGENCKSGVLNRSTSVIDTDETVVRKGRVPVKSIKK